MTKRTAVDQIEVVRNGLAGLLVMAFIGAMGAFTFFIIPTENKDILTYMVGQLSGMATTVLGFYFVSKVGQDALDTKRADTTGKLADAMTTVVKANTDQSGVDKAAEEVAGAAADKRDEIIGDKS